MARKKKSNKILILLAVFTLALAAFIYFKEVPCYKAKVQMETALNFCEEIAEKIAVENCPEDESPLRLQCAEDIFDSAMTACMRYTKADQIEVCK